MEIGAKIVRVKSCPSTNDLAKEMALSGEKEGTVVISEEQTHGKGTKGRSWFSARGKGLYLSVILTPPSPEISLLPLVTGLAVSDSVFSTVGTRIGLKWPNDLVWKGKKLGGLLCESGYLGNRVNYVILGIGLNVSHGKDDFPQEIRAQAVSLKLITNKDTDEKTLLENLWQALNLWYGQFLQGKGERIISAFQERSVLPLGSEVTLEVNGKVVSGIYRGINPQGGLVLEREGEARAFFSAEIKDIKDSQKEG
ncbi:MAG: biotin--[acetyl-CoA-carboxylase] ligase [Candidatus Aminicenantes bacterium]|jgi:BirA family biotin operon repressor/biotin-[acetyl-CoA-carboxylase] ligase